MTRVFGRYAAQFDAITFETLLTEKTSQQTSLLTQFHNGSKLNYSLWVLLSDGVCWTQSFAVWAKVISEFQTIQVPSVDDTIDRTQWKCLNVFLKCADYCNSRTSWQNEKQLELEIRTRITFNVCWVFLITSWVGADGSESLCTGILHIRPTAFSKGN